MQNSKGIYPRIRVVRDYPFETEQSPFYITAIPFTMPFVFIRNFVRNFTVYAEVPRVAGFPVEFSNL